MRIAVFPSAFHPHLGGVEELVRQLAHSYLRAGHEVVVVTNRWPRDLPARETFEGLSVHRIPFRVPGDSLRSRMSFALTHRALRREVTRLLHRNYIDVVHVQCVSSNGEYARLAAQRLGIPLVVTTQGEITMDAGRLYQTSARANSQLRTLMSSAAAVTAVSRKTLLDLESQVGQRLPQAEIIPNGAALAELAGAAPSVREHPYIFALGRLVPEKGFDDLLIALARADVAHDLVLAGTGPMEPALRRLSLELGLGSRVHFIGAADRGQVASLHAGSDFFVLPSKADEGLPLAAIEAMAAGQAVLATRSGGLPEVLIDEESALFVDKGDVEGLTLGLQRLCAEPGLRRRLGAAAESLAYPFDWDVLAARYIETFARALAARDTT